MDNHLPEPSLDSVFAALADPTRRAIVQRLARGPAPVGELADPHDMALPSFMKHIGRLEHAGIILTRKRGRSRFCELAPDALTQVQHWIDTQRAIWDARIDRLQAFAEQMEKDRTDDSQA